MNESPRTEIRPGIEAVGRTCTLLSIIVPCFNEEEVLPETHCRLINVLEGVPARAFEIIYVGDGTRDILRGFQQADSRVRVVILSRNFSQQIALTAGLQSAAGEAVASPMQTSKTRPRSSSRCWTVGDETLPAPTGDEPNVRMKSLSRRGQPVSSIASSISSPTSTFHSTSESSA